MVFITLGLISCVATLVKPIPFDSEVWKLSNDPKSDTRLRMVPSLLQDYWLINWTPDQVKALLGEPWKVEQGLGWVNYRYLLGPRRTFWGSCDFPFLAIQFRDNRVFVVYQLGKMEAVTSDHPLQR
jgi:hypothetical protein